MDWSEREGEDDNDCVATMLVLLRPKDCRHRPNKERVVAVCAIFFLGPGHALEVGEPMWELLEQWVAM